MSLGCLDDSSKAVCCAQTVLRIRNSPVATTRLYFRDADSFSFSQASSHRLTPMSGATGGVVWMTRLRSGAPRDYVKAGGTFTLHSQRLRSPRSANHLCQLISYLSSMQLHFREKKLKKQERRNVLTRENYLINLCCVVQTQIIINQLTIIIKILNLTQ